MSTLSASEALGMLTDMAAVRRDNEHDAAVCNDILQAALLRVEADARSLWAVRVLDRWAELTRSLNWASWPDCGPNGYGCCVTFIDDTTRDYYGPTPDAARTAAAEALVAEDASLAVSS